MSFYFRSFFLRISVARIILAMMISLDDLLQRCGSEKKLSLRSLVKNGLDIKEVGPSLPVLSVSSRILISQVSKF